MRMFDTSSAPCSHRTYDACLLGDHLCRVQGYLMDNCRGEEAVVEGTEIYWNEGDTTELLHFQQGDILGLLVRRQQTYDYIPLLTQTDNTTGYSSNRNGPHEEGHILTLAFPVELSPLISLKLCESSISLMTETHSQYIMILIYVTNTTHSVSKYKITCRCEQF